MKLTKTNFELNTKASEITLPEAIQIATNAATPKTEEEVELLMAACAKISALQKMLEPAAAIVDKILTKTAKELQTDITGEYFTSRDAQGNPTEVLQFSFGKESKPTNVIDSDSLKADCGLTIKVDPNDPTTINISVDNADSFKYFKDCNMQINPNAVTSAIKAGTLDPKYQQTKITEKYTKSAQLVSIADASLK